MSKRRIYHPSETHLALHPVSTNLKCANPTCGVLFTPRFDCVDDSDDPTLCLGCNRRAWSRLWNANRPVETKGEVVSMIGRGPRR